MKLIEIEGQFFNPEAIDLIIPQDGQASLLHFRGGQEIRFERTPHDVATLINAEIDVKGAGTIVIEKTAEDTGHRAAK